MRNLSKATVCLCRSLTDFSIPEKKNPNETLIDYTSIIYPTS